MNTDDYRLINRAAWNKRTEVHLQSEFYDVAGFLNGKSSLNSIELNLLPDLTNKKVLHLQCHFGQDSISLARMGADVTGVDLSDKAIKAAQDLNSRAGTSCKFICCDLYSLPDHLSETFDLVFTTYGTIGWLPDITQWAQLIHRFLKPGGQLVFVEFHPVVWMFDDDFNTITYRYFNSGEIRETYSGTYTNRESGIEYASVSWNHGLSEVIQNLINAGLNIEHFGEYDYSPYNCFANTEEFEKGKFRIQHLRDSIPMVYSILASRM
ncbi:MAG: class I SAM-dependent methyltransferase [Bacteroidetes bacterium]|nr:class I SAM-dependent methyltransferase [Bacteroidota bacterium]